MGMALTEVRLTGKDIFDVTRGPNSLEWFQYLGTRFVPQKKEEDL
jgi:hypothetical protein